MTRRITAPAAPDVDAWNARYPVGTPVRYWPGAREGEGELTHTRSIAWLVCGTPCVAVKGHAGGIALTHVEPEGALL